jgi:hypothetical protein
MIQKATMFVDCGRHENAIATVDALVGSSGYLVEHQPDEVLATAFVEKGRALAGIGKNCEALAASDVIALVVFWRLRYKLSLRDVPEMFLIRSIEFRYEAVRDWEAKLTPTLIDSLRRAA